MFETQMQQSLSEAKLRRYRYFKGAKRRGMPNCSGRIYISNFASPARVLL